MLLCGPTSPAKKKRTKASSPKIPSKNSVYELQSRSMQAAAGSVYHAIAGLNVEANPTIRFKMSKRDRPESDRPCVQIEREKYINECGCVVSNVRFGESVCLCQLSLLSQVASMIWLSQEDPERLRRLAC